MMYKYKLRPSQVSNIVELVFTDASADFFMTDLINTLVLLRPTVITEEEKKGDFIYHVQTDFGDFDLIFGANNFWKIICENENLLLLIDSRLLSSPIFEKEDLSFEDFK